MKKEINLIQPFIMVLILFIITYFSLRLAIEPYLSREKIVLLYAIFTIVVFCIIFISNGFNRRDSVIWIYCTFLIWRYIVQMMNDTITNFILVFNWTPLKVIFK